MFFKNCHEIRITQVPERHKAGVDRACAGHSHYSGKRPAYARTRHDVPFYWFSGREFNPGLGRILRNPYKNHYWLFWSHYLACVLDEAIWAIITILWMVLITLALHTQVVVRWFAGCIRSHDVLVLQQCTEWKSALGSHYKR
jgi:hypothetical protein